jgi:hypothetical protein
MSIREDLNQLFLETVEKVCEASGGTTRVYRHYSGRAMSGDFCLGISIDREVRQLDLGAQLMIMAATVDPDPMFQRDVLDILESSCSESLGLGTIIYFPEIEDSRTERPIVTDYTHPPIPPRNFDWHAWYDGDEETGPYGNGESEKDAIDNLRQQMEVPA